MTDERPHTDSAPENAPSATDANGAMPADAAPDDQPAPLIQSLRERRLITLALADQVGEDRWRTPALPAARSLHDALATLLAWDEWAAAVFEVSLLRGLPAKLTGPAATAEAQRDFAARAIARYQALGRADLLSGVQAAGARVVSAAVGRGAEGWSARRIAGLALAPDAPDAPDADAPPTTPTVADILRWLIAREQRRDELISAALEVSADLDQLRARFG